MTAIATPIAEIAARFTKGLDAFVRLTPHGPSHQVISVGNGWIKVKPVEVSHFADGNMPFWINLSRTETISIRGEP